MDTIAEKVLILDFGSQYSHLIVRRCRECGVYSELLRCDIDLDTIRAFEPKGIILSGGPASVYEPKAPHLSRAFWEFVSEQRIPVLGICYGMQLMQYQLGGTVEGSTHREFGHALLNTEEGSPDALFANTEQVTPVWMSHGDRVTALAPGFRVIATSPNSEHAAVSDPERRLWGVQFHPEVTHTREGKTLLSNFLHTICGISQGAWTMERFIHVEIERLRRLVGTRHVIGAVSGGVDSTVAAALLYRAIGERFHGFLVDTGLLRSQEGVEVIQRLRRELPGLDISVIDASDAFFSALKGITDPETKRKCIGNLFVETFVAAAEELKKKAPPGTFDNAFLLQGTLYPDVIESVCFKGPSHTIKTHHNVGGLPEKMDLTLLEPLRELFKGQFGFDEHRAAAPGSSWGEVLEPPFHRATWNDRMISTACCHVACPSDEVRGLGLQLGLDPKSVWRHPFPGPGLAIRIIGEVTRERAEILRQADQIFIEEIRASGDYDNIGQAFAVLLPECRSVGVMGDQRTYGMTVVLRAIETSDFMTGDWYDMPRAVLKTCATRIMNEVHSINRVCYDISSKPPATIEWE